MIKISPLGIEENKDTCAKQNVLLVVPNENPPMDEAEQGVDGTDQRRERYEQISHQG